MRAGRLLLPVEDDTSSEDEENDHQPSPQLHIHIRFMYVATACYFLAVGLSSLSLIFLVNERIAGSASEPTRHSIFVQTTAVFLNNASSFVSLRYNSGMGDFVGRKPMIIFSCSFVILTRFLYTTAQVPAHFYAIATLAGATESFYYSILAWVCDIVPNHAERSKYYGILMGITGLAGVVVGAPLGAALSISISHTLPFYVAGLCSFAAIVVTVCNPCNDTLTLESMVPEEYSMITQNRALPTSMYHFICSHFPISKSSFQLCMASKNPIDWLTFGMTQWTWNIIPLILVQFLLKVYDWSRAYASLCVLAMGLSLGLVVPNLASHIEPISLSFYSMGTQAIGYFLLSISGSGNYFNCTHCRHVISFIIYRCDWFPKDRYCWACACSLGIIMAAMLAFNHYEWL